MYYEFKGCHTPRCPDKRRGRNFVDVSNVYMVNYPMGQAPSPGEHIPCPTCGHGDITRVFSAINAIVKGSDTPVMEGNQSYLTKVAGQDTKITFVDHPHTDPAYQVALASEAKRQGIGGLSKAYRNEKTGRICVDVASNIPDPLGAIEREKKRNGAQTETKKVNTPVARHAPGPRMAPRGKSYIPLRRT